MKYDAFISYRHTEPDMYIAKKVHKGLETLKVPRGVTRKSGKKKIERVFRDQEELPIGSDLGDNIRTALEESEYLIVICSPRTPQSYWVQKEIDTFISLHGREHILAVLVEGEPQEAFPEKLQVDEAGNPVEPLAADVRGTSRREMDRRLRTELIRLAAPLLHCSYDDLRQRHRERRMKKMMFAASAAAVAGMLFGVYSAYNTTMIRENYRQKQINQSKYLASTALSLLEEGDRQTAALVALEALPGPEEDRPYVASAQYALSAALRCYDMGNVIGMDRSLKHELPVQQFAFDLTGERILSIDQGGTIYVWNVEDGALLSRIVPELDASGYVVSPICGTVYGEHILICDETGIRSVSLTGETEWRVKTENYLLYCDMDEEAGIIACISSGHVTFHDMDTGEMLADLKNDGREGAFGSAYAFSGDKTRFAVSHIKGEETYGCITVYDFARGTWKDYRTEASSVAEIAFCEDGGLVAASFKRSTGQAVIIGGEDTGFVEKFDCGSGGRLWMQEYRYQPFGMDSAGEELLCRSYQDQESGVFYDQVMLSIDQSAYTWDAATGELTAQVKVTGGIRAFLAAKNSCYGYLAESNGTVNIVDMNKGFNYSSLGIETGKNLMDMGLKNGVLVVRSYASPALTMMKYQEGYGRREVASYENNVRTVAFSPEETYYAVKVAQSSQQEEFYFYRGEDDQPAGQWNRLEEEGYGVAAGFLDEARFVYIDNRGVITFYDVETAQTEQLQLGGEVISLECDWNGQRVLLYDSQDYYVVDLQQREVLYCGSTEEHIYCGILSGDGDRIYCHLKDSGLCAVELSSGRVETLNTGDCQLAHTAENRHALSLSPDGGLLAAVCTDGMLRVFNLEKQETAAQIPFVSAYRRFIQFTEDGDGVMLQGDDFYFRVYDLQKQSFSHIAAEQYNRIEQAVSDRESGTVSLITTSDMVILDGDSYEKVAQVDKGLAYLPGQGMVLCRNYGTLYRFPYMTLEMLMDEARAQFGGAELTQLERTQYHVD